MDVFHWLTPFKNNLFAQVQVCNRGNDRAALREGAYRMKHLLKVICIIINRRHFIVPDGFLYNLETFVGMFFDILSPEMNDSVSEEKQFFVVLPVTVTITFDFFDPIIGIMSFFKP